ncbi:MAG: DNA polymerase III subunit gamma/tau [bacterium]|nr:DNA polymerase III subunit gamma/tau [bacterium]
MAYQVTARKWRPQKFDEVVFQDHISKTIKNSLKSGRISHAYLFSGPRGVGKTTMARIVAKALNCLSGDAPVDNPCGECENCVEIRNGSAFDVIEIDGASNRGIENVRELRENVNLAPVKSRYKVYIIDEVHMLTKEAFNALLKTLEEPPQHVVFVFATTEIHRIPETILSRCQKYQFKKIPVEAIVSHLKYIVDKEGYKIKEGALYPIARASEGSMRDSQSLLDQVISFSDGDISEEDTLSILGVVAIESYISLLTYINSASAGECMNEIERIMTLGVDIQRYVAGFVDIIRSARLLCNGISLKGILGFSDEEISGLKGIAEKFTDEELSVVFSIASDMQNDLRFSSNERINLEMALLDMISAKKRPSIAAILQKLDNEGSKEAPAGAREPVSNKNEPVETKSEDSAVENIMNLFHGQIIEKGE